MADLSPTGALRKLLLDLFSSSELLQMFIEDYYQELEPVIDFGKSRAIVIRDTIQVLKTEGCVDDDFFDKLCAGQGGDANKAEIQDVRGQWFPDDKQGVDLLDTPRVAGRPFVNRREIRELAHDIMEGRGQRVTLLTGGELSGKSYCRFLFTHLEAVNTKLRFWEFDFERWSVGGTRVKAAEFADRLAEQMELGIRKFASIDAPVPRRTLDWLDQFNRAARGLPQTWCLFLDSIHKVKVPSETREFIESLADHVSKHPVLPVRIFLPGLDREKIVLPDLRDVATEQPMEGFTRDEAEVWIRAFASSEGYIVNEQALAKELDGLFDGVAALEPPKKATEDLRGILDRVTEESP